MAVRLIGLNNGMWWDEISSLLQSFRLPLADIVGTFRGDNHHPFYSVLAHLSIGAFGEHAWSARLPAALFGAATIPFLYLLGERIMSRREALLASLLLALSYHHVWFSQNARGYAILAFCAVSGAWLLLKGSQEGRWPFFVWYAVVTALGAWTHLTMVFIAVGHAIAFGLVLLLNRAEHRPALIPRAAVAFGLAASLTVVLYLPMMSDLVAFFGQGQSDMANTSTAGWAAAEGVRVLLAGLGGAGAAAALVALVIGGLLFGAGLLGFWRTQRLALLLFVLPVVVTVAGAMASRGTFYPRFFFAMAPYAVLIAVRGAFAAAALIESRRPRWRAERTATAATAVIIALSAVSMTRAWTFPKQNFEGARDFVVTAARGTDVVRTVDVTNMPYRQYLSMPWDSVTTAAELDSLRRDRRVWLLYAFPRYLGLAAPDILALTERECRDAVEFPGSLGDGTVYVCELEPRP